MYDFDITRPASTADATAAHGGSDDALYLAGGQTMIPTLKQRLAMPETVVDLGAVADLAGISDTGDALRIGAMTRHADVAASALVKAKLPALARLAGGIGDPQVRARGTMGGSVANNDPAADYPSAVLALNAQITTATRTIAGEDFFTGMFETALEPGELITAITFPTNVQAGYVKFPNPASRYAVVGAFVARFADGTVRVAITGAAPCVYRWAEAEAALSADFSPAALSSLTADPDDLNADLHASAEYRAHLVGVITARAVEQAAKQTAGAP